MYANSMSLKDIPESKRTVQLCWDAVRQDGMELKYVPTEFTRNVPFATRADRLFLTPVNPETDFYFSL